MEKALKAAPEIDFPTWKSLDEPSLTHKTFEALCAFQIPCIRIKGFANEFRAFDWAKLQSVIWQTDQDAKETLERETKKRLN